MISFNLNCAVGHGFEGWFSSSGDYERQRREGLVSCPVCGDGSVSKAPMAPNVGAKANSGDEPASPPAGGHPTMRVSPPPDTPGPGAMAAAYTALRTLQRKVEKECDYVGDRFAEEARKIHHGETEERGIYGQSSPEDAKALRDEGINVSAVPWLPPEN